jgi:hypothetical protein
MLCMTLGLGTPSGAYEVRTHEELTKLAYSRSVLADPIASPLLEFGIEDPEKPRFRIRPIVEEESELASARKVVSKGAHFEDVPLWNGRFLRHFIDPQQAGIGLTVSGFPEAHPSPTWVLEDQAPVGGQEDSLKDALVHHWHALTLNTQEERDERLGVLLEILGRSVHHMQDMAQPAHTRNDAHPPFGIRDMYEAFTERRFVEQGIPIPSASPYHGAAVDLHVFDTARKFWINDGRGIAEFTSRNFVSMDTNFVEEAVGFSEDPNHPLPVPTGLTSVSLGELGIDALSFMPLIFMKSQIHDAYSGASFGNERASTYSMFNASGLPFVSPRMSLNRFNFEKNYEVLLPRAIAYSAGLINYYFRGRLEVDQVVGSGQEVIVSIRNASAAEFPLHEVPETYGFRLFYDARDGVRREIDLAQSSSDAAWPFDETREFSFLRPADVDARKEHPYVLVFDGTVGTERGVAAVTFGDVASAFAVTPQYAASDGITGSRTIDWRDDAWQLTEDKGAIGGTIDWKGERPGDVLTWGTNPRRYHYATGGSALYMGGRVLTTGPVEDSAPTLGASIRYVNGERTLNVVKEGPGGIRIYSRKFAHSYDNEEPWSPENPLGWRLVHAGTAGSPYTGFFFNARGDEGQYITRDAWGQGRPLKRVKVKLQDDQSFVSDFPAVATVTRTERNFNSEDIDVQADPGICQVTPSVPDGEVVPDPGNACGPTGMSGHRNGLNIMSVTEIYTDKTLVCVDYRGNEEVFCELMPPQDEIIQSTVGDLRIQEQLEKDSYCSVPVVRQNDVSHTITTRIGGARVLRIGHAEIPWSSYNYLNTNVKSYAGSFIHPATYTGSLTGNGSVTTRTTKLIHADARHDFAVYESKVDQSTDSWNGTFSEASPYEYPYAMTGTRTSRKAVMLILGSHSQALFEQETTEDTARLLHDTQGSSWPDGLGGCAPTPLAWDESTTTSHQDVQDVYLNYSLMSFKGSYAIDHAGRLGLSQLIEFNEYPYARHGYRNVLTDGDLPALIPGVPGADGYGYDIRLIR